MKVLEFFGDSVPMPVLHKVRKIASKIGVFNFFENKLLRKIFPKFSRSITAVIGIDPDASPKKNPWCQFT